MKMVIAIIQPHRLDAVRDALTAQNIHGLTITEVRGYGRQKGHTEIYRGAEYQIHYIPKLKLELAVASGRPRTLDRGDPRRRLYRQDRRRKDFRARPEARAPHPHRRDGSGGAVGELAE